MKVIEGKAKGEAVRRPTGRKPVQTNVVDLVARLKESLAATSGTKSAKKAAGKPAARRGRKRAAKKKSSSRKTHAA